MKRAAILVFVVFAPFSVQLRSQEQAVVPKSQPDTGVRRLEVGGTVANLRAGCTYARCPTLGAGFGATINLNSHFALDANVNLTGQGDVETNFNGGRLSEYLFGVRAEARAKRYGYFLTAQPGVLNWNHVITGLNSPPGTFPIAFTYGGVSRFVSDLGAGFEYSPTSRIHLRTDVGDLVMRYGPGNWTNNLQSTAGISVGLGKPIAWTPPVYDARKSHRFFDRTNEVLITASFLGMAADAITTQRFIARGGVEGDPLAKPFVKYGWSGQISLEALEATAVISGMYGLHRLHLHWLERLAPASVATTHGILAYQNSRSKLE